MMFGPGSSPLARGLRTAPSGKMHSRTDHPRSRGVYVILSDDMGLEIGSSPLARGLRHRLIAQHLVLRIIPARAGFTLMCTSTVAMPSDHPRSRGVYCDES